MPKKGRLTVILASGIAAFGLLAAGAYAYLAHPNSFLGPLLSLGGDTASDANPEHNKEVATESQLKLHNAEENQLDSKGGHSEGGNGAASSEKQILMPEIFYQPQSVTGRYAKLLRRLTRAQADLAHGDATAISKQRDVLLEFGAETQVSPKTPFNHEEIEAVAAFLLSGAPPGAFQNPAVLESISSRDRDLMNAVLSFVEGKKEEARPLFEKVKIDSYPTDLRSRLALAKSQVLWTSDPKMSKHYLRQAAALSPGTLVEESARRRLLDRAIADLDTRGFVSSAIVYRRRFRTSLYNGEFLRSLSNGIAAFEKHKRGISPSALALMFKSLERDDAVSALEHLTFAASQAGQQRLCLATAEIGKATAAPQKQQIAFFEVYGGACRVVTEPATALSLLESVDKNLLNPREILVLDSAIRLARAVLGPPMLGTEASSEIPLAPDQQHDDFKASVTQRKQVSLEGLTKLAQ